MKQLTCGAPSRRSGRTRARGCWSAVGSARRSRRGLVEAHTLGAFGRGVGSDAARETERALAANDLPALTAAVRGLRAAV